jgi:hypothetical protein
MFHCLVKTRASLLKDRVATALAVVRGFAITSPVVVIKDEMLAFIADDV